MSRLSQDRAKFKNVVNDNKYKLSAKNEALLALIDVDSSKITDDFTMQLELSFYKGEL